MVVHLSQKSTESRTQDKSGSSTRIKSGYVSAAFLCRNKISKYAIVKRNRKEYAWTRMREPANKPVRDLQMIKDHMSLDMA